MFLRSWDDRLLLQLMRSFLEGGVMLSTSTYVLCMLSSRSQLSPSMGTEDALVHKVAGVEVPACLGLLLTGGRTLE